jgi:hypothetical protein
MRSGEDIRPRLAGERPSDGARRAAERPGSLRRRLACERGQATVNWLAVMVGLTVLAGALVLALPSAAPKITCSFQNVVSKATGGAIPDCNYTAAVDDDVPDPSTCVVSERSGEAGVTVTVFSVKGGGKVKLMTRRTADGKVYVTVEGGAEIGLEFGPPAGAEVSLDAGGASTTQGANAKAGAKLVGNGSVTWVFDNEAKAHEFADIVAGKARDAALDTNPITGIGRRLIGVGEDRPIPAPSIYGLEGGARIFGNAEGGAGPLSGKAEGEIGPSIGGRYDARSGETTVYFKVNANAKLSASLLDAIGGRGIGEGEVQLAVTIDKHGNPTKATVMGSGTVTGQLTGKLAGLSDKAGPGKRADVRLDLDLTDPANRQAFNDFVNNPIGGAPDLARRFADDSEIGVRFYDSSQTDVGIEGSGSIADIEFGLDAGGSYKTADIESAYYYDRETGSFVPWVECKR